MSQGTDPRADTILKECRTHLEKGLGNKQLSADADKLLVAFYEPKVDQRLKAGGDWAKEKKDPLIVAEHLGQICAILSKGQTVSVAVAKAAAEAVKHDEVCPAGGGSGQWCV